MQIIECDDHAHLVSKASSVISGSSPSSADKLRNITFKMEGDSSAILNMILRSLSVNKSGSVY